MHSRGHGAPAPDLVADVPQEGGSAEGPLGLAQPAEMSHSWGASAEGGRMLPKLRVKSRLTLCVERADEG